jgi:hypothetical protein
VVHRAAEQLGECPAGRVRGGVRVVQGGGSLRTHFSAAPLSRCSLPKSPNPEEKPKTRFKEPRAATTHLLGRRTQEQIAIICARASIGYAVAQSFKWMHRNRKWLLSGSYLKSPPQMPFRPGAPDPLTSRLNPFMSIITSGVEVLDTYKGLHDAGARLQAAADRFFEKHAWMNERTRLWQSELRLTCAFAMYAVEVEDLGPPLSPQDMEAIALLLGIRPPEEEFDQDSKSNKQRRAGWKEMMDNAEKDVLPILRRIGAESSEPEQNEAAPPSASEAPENAPASSTPAPAENSQADEGDKR